MISKKGDYSIGSWADESHHESFAVDTAFPEMQSDEGVLRTSLADAKLTSIDSNKSHRSMLITHQIRETPIPTVPNETSYNKAEIDEMVAEIYRVLRTSDDYHSKRLDDIYYPFDNSISCLTTHTYGMKHDIAMVQTHHVVSARESKSINDHTQPSIDATRTSIDADLHHSRYATIIYLQA
ncbi:hypothetical protein Bca52824_074598 [Brassica carinata]|uniref:Uncharacterized protein n=1 Tax=Brassica carinata TaxID=52824 RepID=A0A8X7PMT8_BRACI|nr:hypothetical protein Bca52824_074598 [Brassica carinata]